jgi:hypothetical protein
LPTHITHPQEIPASDFSSPAPGGRNFGAFLLTGVAIVALVGGGFWFMKQKVAPGSLLGLSNPGAPAQTETNPVLVEGAQLPIAPEIANDAVPPATYSLQAPPMPAVHINIPQNVVVLDYEGRPVGPVTQFNPATDGSQNVQFNLRPDLAQYFGFDQGFSMPLDDLEIVSLPDNRYALQLDEQQTRYMATYLIGIRNGQQNEE